MWSRCLEKRNPTASGVTVGWKARNAIGADRGCPGCVWDIIVCVNKRLPLQNEAFSCHAFNTPVSCY